MPGALVTGNSAPCDPTVAVFEEPRLGWENNAGPQPEVKATQEVNRKKDWGAQEAPSRVMER